MQHQPAVNQTTQQSQNPASAQQMPTSQANDTNHHHDPRTRPRTRLPSAWDNAPPSIMTQNQTAHTAHINRRQRSQTAPASDDDPFNWRLVRRCHWCPGSRPHDTAPALLGHFTRNHSRQPLRIDSEHLEQFRLLGIRICETCTKTRTSTANQCNSTECGSRRTKTRPAKRGDILQWNLTVPSQRLQLRPHRPWRPLTNTTEQSDSATNTSIS